MILGLDGEKKREIGFCLTNSGVFINGLHGGGGGYRKLSSVDQLHPPPPPPPQLDKGGGAYAGFTLCWVRCVFFALLFIQSLISDSARISGNKNNWTISILRFKVQTSKLYKIIQEIMRQTFIL